VTVGGTGCTGIEDGEAPRQRQTLGRYEEGGGIR
jgi:hypothetical protein